MFTIIGVDGCPSGWCFVTLTIKQSEITKTELDTANSFQELKQKCSKAAVIMVDIPVGLSEINTYPRLCDKRAKKRLKKRHVCVFPAPPRTVINACNNKNYKEACNIALDQIGKKISQQTYHILPKIREVDKAIKSTDQSRILEVHPELCFMALNQGKPVQHSKKKRLGHNIRYTLLQKFFPQKDIDTALLAYPRKKVARDDVLDALVAAYTGYLYLQGKAEKIPTEPPKDRRGLRMEMIAPNSAQNSST